MKARRSGKYEQGSLFALEPDMPAGFVYRDNFISEAQERDLIARIQALPF